MMLLTLSRQNISIMHLCSAVLHHPIGAAITHPEGTWIESGPELAIVTVFSLFYSAPPDIV